MLRAKHREYVDQHKGHYVQTTTTSNLQVPPDHLQYQLLHVRDQRKQLSAAGVSYIIPVRVGNPTLCSPLSDGLIQQDVEESSAVELLPHKDRVSTFYPRSSHVLLGTDRERNTRCPVPSILTITQGSSCLEIQTCCLIMISTCQHVTVIWTAQYLVQPILSYHHYNQVSPPPQ